MNNTPEKEKSLLALSCFFRNRLFLKMKLALIFSIFLLITNAKVFSQDITNSLKEKLDSLYQKDQAIRFEIMSLQNKFSTESDSLKKGELNNQLKEKIQLMIVQDASNLKLVTDLLDREGWPKKEEVSFNGAQAVFLILQHADLRIQKKYLPLVEKAAQEGNTLPSNLAILKDRIGIRENGEQVYGSQLWTDPRTQIKYVDILTDPENVDERRIKVGLPTMDVYLKQFFQMEWDPIDYKDNILPKLKELKKASNP